MAKITFEQIEAVIDEPIGFCLACGEEQWGFEPDARECLCEVCGEYKVYGAQEILIMGEFE